MKKIILRILFILVTLLALFIIYTIIQRKTHPTLTFIGHASVKLKSKEGKVIYIDPFYNVKIAYKEPADYILITHEHDDHNKVNLCKQAKDCKVIHWYNALIDGEYQTFEDGDIKIEAVPSGGNKYHSVGSCVGYIVTLDGVSVYHAGDTSMNDALKPIAQKHIDYAMYPIDGYYDMGPKEASEVSDMIGATYNIPIHGNGKQYTKQRAQFNGKGKKVVLRLQTITLRKTKDK